MEGARVIGIDYGKVNAEIQAFRQDNKRGDDPNFIVLSQETLDFFKADIKRSASVVLGIDTVSLTYEYVPFAINNDLDFGEIIVV